MVKKIIAIAMGVGLMAGAAVPAFAQTGPNPNAKLQVQQNVRNLSQQLFAFSNSVQARPGDRLEYQIVVRSTGTDIARGVYAKVVLPSRIGYAANFKINGASVSGNPVIESVPIGDIPAGQIKTLTFEGLVASANAFDTPSTSLIATVTIFSTDAATTGSAIVMANRDGVPTDVSTAGFFEPWMIAAVASVLMLFLASYALLFRYYISNNIVKSAYATRTDRKLAKMIERIKKTEGKFGKV
ncbi:MAG: DUF11 domain-containing protein [Candidatus Wildermuthbacteria bacterium]|nr:DUF11 domain-containing protein [Candidatus Wildermuthbacteria bacterium]